MSVLLKKYPLHPWLLALYPVLALLAHNANEVTPSVAVRPAIISLALATAFFAVCWLLTRNPAKAALYASLLLLLFFSYGNLYQFLRTLSGSPLFSRHRYLIPLYLGLFAVAVWGIRRLRDTASATQTLNIVALVLFGLPLLSLANYYRTTTNNAHQVRAAGATDTGTPLKYSGQGTPPDVYFILLDAYMRGDALKRDMQFDNSDFLNSLKDMGFYVADCSRPNYDFTHASVTSTLNMEYLPELQQELRSEGISDSNALWALLLNSKTRNLLKGMGYRSVAFATTFHWTEMEDADVYLAPGRNSENVQSLLPFEAMLLKGTAAVILTDSDAKFFNRAAEVVNFPFDYHVKTELYVLDTLPKLAKMPGPKFVFVHILIPHVPHVFEPDGTVRVDPNYYGAQGANGIDSTYQRNGYVDSVQFINSRMLPILKTLIEDSPTPPIIVMEGDHGLSGQNRTQNLSTYYLPGVNNKGLYAAISPVNSFRVIFNDYFGAHYQLLPDMTYRDFSLSGGNGAPTPEFASQCQP